MTEREAKALVTLLKAMYPKAEVPRETWNGYAHYLADLEFEVAKDAVDELVRSSRFFPTVAEIRELVAEHICGLPDPETAWLEVERAVRGFDPGDSATWTYSGDFSCAEIGAAVEALGGVSVLHSQDGLSHSRREFLLAYSAVRGRAIRQAQLPLPAAAVSAQELRDDGRNPRARLTDPGRLEGLQEQVAQAREASKSFAEEGS